MTLRVQVSLETWQLRLHLSLRHHHGGTSPGCCYRRCSIRHQPQGWIVLNEDLLCDLDCPLSFAVRLGEARTACYVLRCVVISELFKLLRRELRSVVCCYFVTQSPSSEHVRELQDHSSTSSRCQMGDFQVYRVIVDDDKIFLAFQLT